jgi:hypothetical protein
MAKSAGLIQAMRNVAEKMGLEPGARSYFSGASDTVLVEMKLPTLHVSEHLDGLFDHIHVFVSTAIDLNRRFPKLKSHVGPKGKLWVSWPKGGSRGTDLNIRDVIRIGYSHGMVESTALSINEVWSAIKFTHPIPGKIYQNTYGKLPV